MKRITYEDRKVLEKLLRTTMSKRGIGRALGFSHSNILYEISEHSGDHIPYSAENAQAIYERNQLQKGNVKKLEKNAKLREYVIAKLEEDLSPEEISGRLKEVSEEQAESNEIGRAHV